MTQHFAATEKGFGGENDSYKSSKSKNKPKQTLTDESNSMSVYEQLLPENESKLMRYMRSWERRIGFVTPLVYWNIFLLSSLHFVAAFGCCYYLVQGQFLKWQTTVFLIVMTWMAGFGVTGGAHRLWAHRTYKATLPLKLIMLFLYTVAGHNSVHHWVRNHRVHHKCSDTVADPHDSTRGLFYSHCGWLMMKRHPRVIEEGSKIDMSDIENDPLLRLHSKYNNVLRMVFCFGLPALVPVFLWGENWGMAALQSLLRFLITLNMAWCVNSVAHKFGTRPYNREVKGVENKLISLMTMGEGWHNYHHSFPWDYKAAELPFSVTTRMLDVFASVGWAYDLKTASPTVIQQQILLRGDK